MRRDQTVAAQGEQIDVARRALFALESGDVVECQLLLQRLNDELRQPVPAKKGGARG